MRIFRRKPCKECLVVKTLRMFYRHRSYRDGRMNTCKECHRRNVLENYELKRAYYQVKHAETKARPKHRAARAAYAKTPRGREVHRTASQRYRRLKRLFEVRA